jgi:hypothetical protein
MISRRHATTTRQQQQQQAPSRGKSIEGETQLTPRHYYYILEESEGERCMKKSVKAFAD